MASELLQLLSASGGVEEETDVDFNEVITLLHFDGSSGATNNTFLDSSSNAGTVTTSGSPIQGTFSPFSAEVGKWSYSFPGNTAGYLSNTNGMTAIGNGDFTIEFWARRLSNVNGGFFQYTASPLDVKSGALGLGVYNDEYYLYYGTSGALAGRAVTSSNIPTDRSWFHVAYVRSSGTITIYTDGTAVTTQASTTNYTDISFTLGGYYSNSFLFGGEISNFRVVKGTAVYTSNFTPSTTPLTAISGTILLTAQSNRFVDTVEDGALTVQGLSTLSPSVLPSSPFAFVAAYDETTDGGSAYFNSAYTSLAASSDFNILDDGTFTVDFWSYVYNYNASYADHVGVFNGVSSGWLIYQNGANLDVYVNGSAVISTTRPPYRVWNHIALTRDGTTLRLFINGALEGSSTASLGSDQSQPLRVGGDTGGGRNGLDGYISNFRLVKGTAVYTSAFTPPTAPVTAITNTEALLNFTNAAIFDQARKTNISTVNNAQLDTSVKKFGTASVEFDGTDDYLKGPQGPLISPRNGSWTYECFIYPKTIVDSGGYGTVFDTRTNNPGDDGVALFYKDNGGLEVYGYGSGGAYITTSTGVVTLDQWQHVALVQDIEATNAPITLYVNGTSVGSQTSSTWSTRSSGRLVIGAQQAFASEFTGFIDEFRVTTKARYTTDFVPPAKAFPNAGKPLASGTIAVTYVIISGGGGGGKQGGSIGMYGAGGGGAGGVVTGTANISSGTSVTVTVGAGGAGITGNVNQTGNNGTASSIATINTTSVGGGGGAKGAGSSSDGNDGGSGGGASVTGTPGSGTSGQGNDGGDGTSSSPYGGGGGGGAGSVGGDADGTRAGAGGSGTSAYSAWATATSTGASGLYAGGGGGSGYQTAGTQGLAGSGGGGQGGSDADVAAAGTANTGGGGGGGGGRAGTYPSAAGGSGIVMIRYAGSQAATGGSVVTTDGFTYHTFITSGTFTNN